MLVHKGGQINTVQLITGLRIAKMSQIQNCSVMCTKNGSYYDNDKVRGRVQGRCERRSEAFVKIHFFSFFFFFLGGGVGVGAWVKGGVGFGWGSGWMGTER